MEFQLTFAGTAGHGWEWVAAHERVVCVGENVIPLERTGNRLAGIWNNPVRRQGKQRTRTGGLVGDTEWERRVSHRELEIFAGGKRKWEKWIGSVRWLVDFWKVRFIRTKNTLCLIKENVTSVERYNSENFHRCRVQIPKALNLYVPIFIPNARLSYAARKKTRSRLIPTVIRKLKF